MTPKDLLDDVKSRFMVLLVGQNKVDQNDQKLEKYLKQALGKYEDKAGVILEVWQDDVNFILPLPHYLYAIGACDAKRRYVPWRKAVETDEDGKQIEFIKLLPTLRAAAPYCLYYLADLRNWPSDINLPRECASLVADYLEALIAVQNSERLQNLYLTTGMHDSVQNIPSQQELRQRIAELEVAMEENKAIVPPASYF